MAARLSLLALALVAPSTGLRLPTSLPGSIGDKAVGRREAAALLASAMAAVLTGGTQAASAGAGSVVKLDLAVKTYVEVECPEALAQGRAGGALGAGAGGGGIAQKCVQVKVRLCNPDPDPQPNSTRDAVQRGTAPTPTLTLPLTLTQATAINDSGGVIEGAGVFGRVDEVMS